MKRDKRIIDNSTNEISKRMCVVLRSLIHFSIPVAIHSDRRTSWSRTNGSIPNRCAQRMRWPDGGLDLSHSTLTPSESERLCLVNGGI